MSGSLISRSPDLLRLRELGYSLEVRETLLLVHDVPYVNADCQVSYGTLASSLELQGDVTTRPQDHTVSFAGQHPCDARGAILPQIQHSSEHRALAPGVEVDHLFSHKPVPSPDNPSGGYLDYYEKVTTYVRIISAPAVFIDASATPLTFAVIEEGSSDSVFAYMETASSRAGIAAVSAKLRGQKVAIVGLGGTGSYVLDLIAKTHVEEIHLFDGDILKQHNAFRAVGAVSITELRQAPNKATYFRDRYAHLRPGTVFAHEDYIEAGNVELLAPMNFVFLCLDDGPAKKLIVEKLEEWGTSFVDVGVGLLETGGSITGQVRVTASTATNRQHVCEHNRIPFGPPDPDNDYRYNVQIAELNALNATLAVIKWKKLMGFYFDFEHEHHSVYVIDGNRLINDDQARD
jgi:molybdopterin/thiamine biosynthesis adenylyltransferase